MNLVGAQYQTQSPSFFQAAVITPTYHPRPSLSSLLSGGWPAPWEGERGNWEAGGLEGAIIASLTLHLMEITLLWHKRAGCSSPCSAAYSPPHTRILTVALITCARERCSCWPDYLMVQLLRAGSMATSSLLEKAKQSPVLVCCSSEFPGFWKYRLLGPPLEFLIWLSGGGPNVVALQILSCIK